MCKVEMLKALLNQRLSAAVDEIFGLLARTIAEYEEELCRTKEENERQRQLLDAVFRPQAETLAADVNEEDLLPEQQEWSSKVDHQDPEVVYVKEEEEEADITELPSTCVSFKSEDDDDDGDGQPSNLLCHQSEQSRWMQPPSSSSSQHVTTESDGDHRGESQTDSLLAPLSDEDNRTSHSKGDTSWHTNNMHFNCSQCDKTFGSKYTLSRHMKSHAVCKEYWKCSQCGRTLGDRRNLRRHMMVHTGEKPFMCSVCGKRFSQKANLITHTRTHTGEKPFSCSVCSKRFGDRSALIQHKKTHNGGKRFACVVYTPNLNTLYVLKMCKVEILRAMLNARLSAAVEEIFGVLARTIAEYEEELCRTKEENERQRQLLDAVFKPQHEPHKADVSEENLPLEQQEWKSRVEQQEAEPSQYQGEEEEEAPADPFLIKEEEEREHRQLLGLPFSRVIVKSEYDEDKSQSGENRAAEPSSSSSQHLTAEGDVGHCGGSQADSRLALLSDSHSPDSDDELSKTGMTRHTGNTHWKCSQCNKNFGNKSSLRVHMRIHAGDKRFMCSVCGKRFSQKAHLITHTRIHTGDKPFSCSVCNKSFIDHSALVKHTRTHTGEKPFACAVCNVSFSDRSNLGKHMKRHTGEKPFACSLCGKTFSIRGHLRTHTRTHTGEKPFTCAICKLNFSDRSGLIHHRRTHTGAKRFSCLICGKQFSQRGRFTKHIQIHSGEKPFSCGV
ncbi:uncharacterized protein LOC144050339 [Vanacampus margaritifer]